MSESEKQRIECGSAADQRIEKKQRIEDSQQRSDDLLLKQAERIRYLEGKLKMTEGTCNYLKERVETYKQMVEDLMDAGDYSGPEGDQYAVPSVNQMQGINVSLRHYEKIMRDERARDETDDDDKRYPDSDCEQQSAENEMMDRC